MAIIKSLDFLIFCIAIIKYHWYRKKKKVVEV